MSIGSQETPTIGKDRRHNVGESSRVGANAAVDRPHSGGGLRRSLPFFLFGSLVAALYAFFIYPHQKMIDPTIDVNGFGQLGRHIAAGDGFSLGYGPTIRRAPLYPALVALLLTLFGHTGPDAQVYRPVIAVQCLIVGLSCVTAWTLARKLFGTRTGMVAGVICALTPQTLRYVGMTEVETLMGLLIALMALTGLNLYRAPTSGNGALFGLAVAAATLTKPVALLYPFVFLALAWWRWRKRALHTSKAEARDRPFTAPLRASAAALGVFILCLLPWSLRNWIVTEGRFKGISSNAPGEFLRGYVNAQPKYYLLRQDFGSADPSIMMWDWEANLYEDALLQRHGMSFFSVERFGPNGEKRPMEARIALELKKDAIESAEVKRRLREEPLGFLRKFGIQLFTFWYIVNTRKMSLVVGGFALAALGLAAFGWLRARRNGIETFPAIAVVAYFHLLYAAILAFARYSMPVFPTLLALSAYGLTQLVRRRGSSEVAPPSS